MSSDANSFPFTLIKLKFQLKAEWWEAEIPGLAYSAPEPSWDCLAFSAPCETKPYLKSDGKYFCGFTVKSSLNWQQADDACKTRGGRLPEVYNFNDNVDIMKQRVSSRRQYLRSPFGQWNTFRCLKSLKANPLGCMVCINPLTQAPSESWSKHHFITLLNSLFNNSIVNSRVVKNIFPRVHSISL